MRSDADAYVQSVYDELNRDGFGDVLPRITVIARDHDAALTWQGAWVDHRRKRIEVAAFLTEPGRRRDLEQVLIHEATHLRGAFDHGDYYQAELRRVAALARWPWVAAWVEREILRVQKLKALDDQRAYELQMRIAPWVIKEEA